MTTEAWEPSEPESPGYATELDGILGDAVGDSLALDGVAAVPMHTVLVFTYLDERGDQSVGWFGDSSSTHTDTLGLLHHALIGVEASVRANYASWQEPKEPDAD